MRIPHFTTYLKPYALSNISYAVASHIRKAVCTPVLPLSLRWPFAANKYALGKSTNSPFTLSREPLRICYKSPTHSLVGHGVTITVFNNLSKHLPDIFRIPFFVSLLKWVHAHNEIPHNTKLTPLLGFREIICKHIVARNPLEFALPLRDGIRDKKESYVDVTRPLRAALLSVHLQLFRRFVVLIEDISRQWPSL